MSLYRDIVEHVMSLDPTGAPGRVEHPDDCRTVLVRISERRAAGERIRGEAMLDLAVWIPAARAAGLSVVEIASLSGVTRKTVYDTIGRDHQ